MLYFVFPFLFVLWWFFVLRLISLTGGWSGLAKRYPLPDLLPAPQEIIKFQSLRMGLFTNYRNSIHISLYEEGFEMRPFKLYTLFHPSIFIRWEMMERAELKSFIGKYLIFHLGNKRMTIWGRSAEELYRRAQNNSP